MELITEEFKKVMKDYPLYSQEKEKDPLVLARFYYPLGKAQWLITEFNLDSKIAFGYAMLGYGEGFDELGYVDIRELEETEFHLGCIERDLHFEPCRLSECSSLRPAK